MQGVVRQKQVLSLSFLHFYSRIFLHRFRSYDARFRHLSGLMRSGSKTAKDGFALSTNTIHTIDAGWRKQDAQRERERAPRYITAITASGGWREQLSVRVGQPERYGNSPTNSGDKSRQPRPRACSNWSRRRPPPLLHAARKQLF